MLAVLEHVMGFVDSPSPKSLASAGGADGADIGIGRGIRVKGRIDQSGDSAGSAAGAGRPILAGQRQWWQRAAAGSRQRDGGAKGASHAG